MANDENARYLSLLEDIKRRLAAARGLGSAVNLLPIVKDMQKANDLAEQLGEAEPYPAKLVSEVEAMQERIDYYNRTGTDAPSLSLVADG